MFVGKVLHYKEQITSTNDYLLELVSKNSPIEGTVALSFNQSAGKGQPVREDGQLVRNSWFGTPGKNIAMSLLLRPRFLPIQNHFLLTMTIANAIYDLLEQNGFKEIGIKWPNDVLIVNKKITGILIETGLKGNQLNYAVCGIGLNVNEHNFPLDLNQATSMSIEHKNDFELEDIFHGLCEQLEKWYLILKQGKDIVIKSSYLNRLYRYQELAEYIIDGKVCEASIIGVDSIGRITLDVNGKLQSFQNKEIAYKF